MRAAIGGSHRHPGFPGNESEAQPESWLHCLPSVRIGISNLIVALARGQPAIVARWLTTHPLRRNGGESAIRQVIFDNPQGSTKAEVRSLAKEYLGEEVKEGSLKQALRLLSKEGEIFNDTRRWFPKEKQRTE